MEPVWGPKVCHETCRAGLGGAEFEDDDGYAIRWTVL